MHNKTWKEERDLLSEAYQSVTETDHSKDEPALAPGEKRQSDGSVVDKDGKTVYTPKDKKKLEEADIPFPAGDQEPSVDTIEDMPSEVGADPMQQELDADVKDLISLIANPPPEEELTRLGYEGRLSEYVSMLQKKVDAAQAQLDLRKPAEESS